MPHLIIGSFLRTSPEIQPDYVLKEIPGLASHLMKTRVCLLLERETVFASYNINKSENEYKRINSKLQVF
jgi:hypothetical protein